MLFVPSWKTSSQVLKRELVRYRWKLLHNTQRSNQNNWEQWFCSRRRPTFGLFVKWLIRSQKWSAWLCSSGCTEEQLAVISMCLRGSPHRTTIRSARALDSQYPELETSLFQHLICFAAGAPFWECRICMLFSSPLQARETLNRIRTEVELVLWSPRLSSPRGMLMFGYYKGKFDTFYGVVVVHPHDASEQMVLWFEGLWDTDIPMHLVFKGQCFPMLVLLFLTRDASIQWYQCWYWHF